MVNEFRTLNLECSNLVPQGPGYENITLENQVCAVVGSIPKQVTVNGLRYLKLSFNYEWSHMWMVRASYLLVSASLHPRRTLASFSLLALPSSQHTSSSLSLNPKSQRFAPFSPSSVELLHEPRPPDLYMTMSKLSLLLPQTLRTIFAPIPGRLRKLWRLLRR